MACPPGLLLMAASILPDWSKADRQWPLGSTKTKSSPWGTGLLAIP